LIDFRRVVVSSCPLIEQKQAAGQQQMQPQQMQPQQMQPQQQPQQQQPPQQTYESQRGFMPGSLFLILQPCASVCGC
jgi:hypothetical protein